MRTSIIWAWPAGCRRPAAPPSGCTALTPTWPNPLKIRRFARAERSLLPYALRRPIGLAAPLHLLRMGAAGTDPVTDAHYFADQEPLDVAGWLIPVHVPGHTPGSTAFLLPTGAAAFTGDALVTHDSVVGHHGLCLLCLAFTTDGASATRSLQRLAGLDARVVLPGHGEPWPVGLAAAAATALQRGIR